MEANSQKLQARGSWREKSWTMYAAASLILIGSKDYYCISTLCSTCISSKFKLTGLAGMEDVHTAYSDCAAKGERDRSGSEYVKNKYILNASFVN